MGRFAMRAVLVTCIVVRLSVSCGGIQWVIYNFSEFTLNKLNLEIQNQTMDFISTGKKEKQKKKKKNQETRN